MKDRIKTIFIVLVVLSLTFGCLLQLIKLIRKDNFPDCGVISTPVEDNGGVIDDKEPAIIILQSTTFDGTETIASNGFFTVSGNQSSGSYNTPVGVLSNALKMESTTTITFVTDTDTILMIYTDPVYVGKRVKVDEVIYTYEEDEDGYTVAVVAIEAGNHTISKGDAGIVTYISLIKSN